MVRIKLMESASRLVETDSQHGPGRRRGDRSRVPIPDHVFVAGIARWSRPIAMSANVCRARLQPCRKRL